jgi:hypothetical protein
MTPPVSTPVEIDPFYLDPLLTSAETDEPTARKLHDMTRPICHLETCDRPTNAGLCAPHRTELLDRLAGLRRIVDDLNVQLTRQAIYSTAGSITTDDGDQPTSSVPWNEGASRTLERISTTMRRWDRLAADRLGAPVRHPNPLRAAAVIRGAIAAGQLNAWTSLARLLDDLRDIDERANRTIDRPKVQRFLGICTTTIDISLSGMCDTRLYELDDVESIQCPSCGTTHLVDADLDLLLTLADDTLVTTAQAARAMSTRDDADAHRNRLEARIRTWNNRGRITPRGTTTVAGIERKLYRLGDIRSLVTDHDRTTRR